MDAMKRSGSDSMEDSERHRDAPDNAPAAGSSFDTSTAPTRASSATSTPTQQQIVVHNSRATCDPRVADQPKQRKKKAIAHSAADTSSSSSFPTPFKCSGDFCGVVLHEQQPPHRRTQQSSVKLDSTAKRLGGNASIATSSFETTALRMLFPPDEAALLLDSESLSNLTLSIRDPTAASSSKPHDASALHVLAYKSIALGKANREHLTQRLRAQTRSLNDNKHTGQSNSVPHDKHVPKRSSLLDSTAAHEFRQGSRLRMFGAMGDSVASYYRQVRVCNDCYAIYTLLDATRMSQSKTDSAYTVDTSNKHRYKRKQQQAHAHAQQQQHTQLKDEWKSHVAREVADKERLYLRKNNASSTSAVMLDAAAGVAPADAARFNHSPSTPAPIQISCDNISDDDSVLPVLLTPKAQSQRVSTSDGSLATHSPSETDSPSQLNTSTSMPALPGSHRVTCIHNTGKHSCFALSSSSVDITKTDKSSAVAFKGLDRYLRGESKRIDEPVLVEGQLFRSIASTNTTTKLRLKTPPAADTASVLLIDADATSLELLHRNLQAIATLSLEIESVLDVNEALAAAKTFAFDLILCERTFPPPRMAATATTVASGLDFVRLLRQFELQQSIATSKSTSSASAALLPRRATVVCVTTQTTPADLQLYRDAGMDGCIGKPISYESLRHTVVAALTRVASSASACIAPSNSDAAVASANVVLARAKHEQQERKRRRRQRLEAASALPLPGLADMDARDNCVSGTFQMDAATSLPFCVMGRVELQPQHIANTFFNLVVVHDVFDTWERLQILLQPIIARYHGAIQVLVWNYPGQAYTTWRHGTLLNNVYHAQCLNALLQHVGVNGLRLWRDAPYYLMGIGNGGSIATTFCTHAPPLDRNTRALLLVNAFVGVDAQLAQFFHDCLKVFMCTPASRPDLPVYFHTRFLFSSAYLARVSTPLALNLYTAVMNPITLDGRRALCQGALAHVDPVPLGATDRVRLHVPLVSVCSAQNALVDAAAQTHKLAQRCGLDVVESIGKVLRQPPATRKQSHQLSCVVSLPGGHEIFQECKQDLLLLIEQLVTGYHEANDVSTKALGTSAHDAGAHPLTSCSVVPNKPHNHDAMRSKERTTGARDEDDAMHKHQLVGSTGASSTTNKGSFEDAFIDNVLSTVQHVVDVTAAPPTSNSLRPIHSNSNSSNNQRVSSPEQTKWTQFQREQAHKTTASTNAKPLGAVVVPVGSSSAKSAKQTSPSKLVAMTSWDPTTPAFERLSSNVIYKVGDGSKIYPDPQHQTTTSKTSKASGASHTTASIPELKEYMEWRVKRNQKRLQRMANQARVIQRAFRAFYARTLVLRLKRERCAVALQRHWRARMARKKYKGMQKEDWAVRLLQRHWRGKMGRDSYRDRFRKYLAAVDIQRIARGFVAKRAVVRIRRRLYDAAVTLQRRVRQFLATRRTFAKRRMRNSAVSIQRVFRGHVGRKRFAYERDKFLYAQTQSQGIAFGQQMLMEYKLYGTKLQSDVAVLAQAKVDVEAQAEVLINEICAFDDGIRLLETEMHALSQVETESLAAKSGGNGNTMDEQSKWALREQKMRLDREFTQMLAQIAQRKEKLRALEESLQRLDRERLSKENELKSLERKLVVLLDDQQHELEQIKRKQQTRNQLVLDLTASSGGNAGASNALNSVSPSKLRSVQSTSPTWSLSASDTALSPSRRSAASIAAANATSAYTQQQREEANSLMESTETMMKFGFMSMSMTYFSSMNMVRAMRKIGAHHMTLDSAAAVANKHWPEYATSPGAAGSSDSTNTSSSSFQPAVPPGSFPGQQPLQVAGWSVGDIGRWLDTLALGQYKRAFADAAVDGALLLHLNDDDLKNTLGIEHRLHRKKVLTSVEQLRDVETAKMRKLYGSAAHNPPTTASSFPSALSPESSKASPLLPSAALSASPLASPSANTNTSNNSSSERPIASIVVAFPEFCALVRHGKLKQLKEALANVPDRRFDALTVRQAFAPGVGTLYDDALEKSAFHINKSDEHGNAPLLLAAQNNNLKVAQLLLAKGANPNHQNRNGNTAGHYAMAYSFFDLGAWLLDPDKGGGRDDVLNESGLTAYDGLS